MKVTIPIGSIMWAKTPNTDNYMPYRMRTLIQFWRVVGIQKTELLTVRYSGNGGVQGENNHPSGSAMDLPLGRYCFVIYNLSENQVPINQIVLRGDSADTGTIWGCAKDINGNACYQKVESGEKKEIYFDLESFEGSQYYHLDCNAWFVTGGLEQRFTSTAIDTVKDYGLNPLRIGRPLEDNGSLSKANYISIRNYITGEGFELPNTQYFEGSKIINPFYEPDNNIATQNPIYSNSGSGTQTPNPQNPQNKKKIFIVGSLALLTLFSIRKNENNLRNDN